MRTIRRVLCALVAVGFLAVAPAAGAVEQTGIADQSAAMFASSYFQPLNVPISRLVVSYDAVLRGTYEVADIDAWLYSARISGIEPLIAFNHARGCYDGKGVVRKVRCRLPSVQRFQHAFESFRSRYPFVTVYSPWNEANHVSQPTQKRPGRAAAFYNVVRRGCPSCTVVAVDVLDIHGMADYVRTFRRHADGTPQIWGLHNYHDANDGGSSATRELLRTVTGEVWLTETGGIVKLGKRRPFDPRRAKSATKHMFAVARVSPRITRMYIYNWTGGGPRFDSGLTTAAGKPRPAYYVVRSHLGFKPVPPPPPPAPGPPPPPPACLLLPALCP